MTANNEKGFWFFSISGLTREELDELPMRLLYNGFVHKQDAEWLAWRLVEYFNRGRPDFNTIRVDKTTWPGERGVGTSSGSGWYAENNWISNGGGVEKVVYTDAFLSYNEG